MKIPFRVVVALLASSLSSLSNGAFADTVVPWNFIDAASVKRGEGNNVTITGIGLRSKNLKTWNLEKLGVLGLSIEGRIDDWHGHEADARITQVYDLCITPVLRLEHPLSNGVTPYVEMGLGAHLLSHVHINHERTFSTAYQFGEFVGTGVRFGERKEYEVGVILQHDSNASIKRPNNGLTYGALLLNYHFR